MNTNLLTNISGIINRRNFLRNMALIGASGVAATTLQAGIIPNNSNEDPFQMGGAPAKLPAKPTKLTVKMVLENARETMSPDCQICPECDGIACAGEHAIGSVGSGMSFQNNYTSLKRICLRMSTLVDNSDYAGKVDTSTVIFGRKLDFPVLAAPVGPNGTKIGKGMDKQKYFDAIIGGCIDAGGGGSIGDNATLTIDEFKKHCGYMSAVNGPSFITLKPRPANGIIPLIPFIEESGAFMINMDVDSGPGYLTSELKKIVQSTKLPVVVKGVMTIEDAKRARDAGAKGIVVSNHGGRRLDYTQGTSEVLPLIADAMNGELTIFADGCVRYGGDVLKYLALGADAVYVGRHIIKAAYGGGREGVALFMNAMKREFASTMRLTGVTRIDQINRNNIVY